MEHVLCDNCELVLKDFAICFGTVNRFGEYLVSEYAKIPAAIVINNDYGYGNSLLVRIASGGRYFYRLFATIHSRKGQLFNSRKALIKV